MLTVYHGNDRLAIEKAITQHLGAGYELFEGESLTPSDLPSVFQGASLFSDSRRILIKDLQDSSSAWSELPKYFNTVHDVIVWETKLDKRSATYKAISKDKSVAVKEITLPDLTDKWLAFTVFDLAAAGKGQQAVQELDKSIASQDPYMFFGSIIAAATKAYEKNPHNARNTHALKQLAKTDLDIKTTGLDPWLIIKSVLLRLS